MIYETTLKDIPLEIAEINVIRELDVRSIMTMRTVCKMMMKWTDTVYKNEKVYYEMLIMLVDKTENIILSEPNFILSVCYIIVGRDSRPLLPIPITDNNFTIRRTRNLISLEMISVLCSSDPNDINNIDSETKFCIRHGVNPWNKVETSCSKAPKELGGVNFPILCGDLSISSSTGNVQGTNSYPQIGIYTYDDIYITRYSETGLIPKCSVCSKPWDIPHIVDREYCSHIVPCHIICCSENVKIQFTSK